MLAYGYLMRMRILTALAYRFEVWIGVVGDVIMLTAYVFIWKAAYGGGIDGSGASVIELHSMISYSVLAVLLACIFQIGVQDTIYQQVREGNIAMDLLRPIPLLGTYFANDVGNMISALVNKALPLLVIAAALFGFPKPSSFGAFAIFLVSALLSFFILWLMSALVGLVAFWVAELGNLGMVKDAVVRILSGSFVPLWFFPSSVQRISEWLPFQYTYQTPIGIYVGATTIIDAWRAIGVQVLWVIVFFLLLSWVWRYAKSKVMIQGG
jgi:ABC-2 type transport system permease protein